jgi:DNA-binding response OmpR family regulator
MTDPNEQSQEGFGQKPSPNIDQGPLVLGPKPWVLEPQDQGDQGPSPNVKRILVVEDELETADMLRTYFEFCGYKVFSTAWGKDVLRICRESHPDLIILDIQLPDTNGYEVYQELGNTEQTSRIPVIFLTKLVDDDLKAISREAGVLDYITKPFDLEELERRVQDALR